MGHESGGLALAGSIPVALTNGRYRPWGQSVSKTVGVPSTGVRFVYLPPWRVKSVWMLSRLLSGLYLRVFGSTPMLSANAAVAQQAVQPLCKGTVGGSTPLGGSDIACTPTGPKGFDGENKSHVNVQAALDPLYQASRPTANDNASAPALAA